MNNETKLENFISLHGKEKASALFDEMLDTLHRYAFSYDDEDEDNNDDVIDLLKNVGDWNDEI